MLQEYSTSEDSRKVGKGSAQISEGVSEPVSGTGKFSSRGRKKSINNVEEGDVLDAERKRRDFRKTQT